jgi:hypothetical protein
MRLWNAIKTCSCIFVQNGMGHDVCTSVERNKRMIFLHTEVYTDDVLYLKVVGYVCRTKGINQ